MNIHTIFIIVTICLWVAVTVYWIVSAGHIEEEHKGEEVSSFVGLFLAGLITYTPLLNHHFMTPRLLPNGIISGLVETLACLAGIATMILAKKTLGNNWSGKVVIQKEHTITRSGPYKYVRHPIYSGGLLALYSCAFLTGQVLSFMWVFICTIWLIIKIGMEENLLTKQFPDEYPLYKKQVRKLIPFIW